jgi:hypothetical protein
MVVYLGVGGVMRDGRGDTIKGEWHAVARVPKMLCGGVGARVNVLVSVDEIKGVWV